MFKKRDKTQNGLKRTAEDRYLDESAQEEEGVKKRVKEHEHQGCSHGDAGLKASTKDHIHYREAFIREEVGEVAAFKGDGGNQKDAARTRRENATSHLEIDTPYDHDAFALAKQNIQISKGIKEGKLDPNVYRGLHGY